MKKTLLSFCFLFAGLLLVAKEQARSKIITLEGDTINGTIKVPKAFFKNKLAGFAYVQLKVSFTDNSGAIKVYMPNSIQGFLIYCEDGSVEKFISAKGGYEVIDDAGISLSGNDKAFGKRGYGALFGIGTDQAFVHVIKDDQYLKHYAYYEEVATTTNAGTMPMTTSTLVTREVIRKGDGPFLILNARKKKRRAELIEMLGDCEKLNRLISAKKLDVYKGLEMIVKEYNNWYESNN